MFQLLRWQFSLRALLCLITFVGLFLAYHVEWIHHRAAIRQDKRVSPCNGLGLGVFPPLVLWMVGEQGERCLWVRDATLAEARYVKQVFPEARVSLIAADGDWVTIEGKGRQ